MEFWSQERVVLLKSYFLYCARPWQHDSRMVLQLHRDNQEVHLWLEQKNSVSKTPNGFYT